LRWSDIDFLRGIFYVRRAIRDLEVGPPKTDSSLRTVDLLAPALAALQRQRQVSEAAGGEVWLNPGYHTHGGKYSKPIWFKWPGDKILRRAFDPACKAAGVRRRTPRQCRHTCVSWQLSIGEPLFWVSRTLGHGNIETTAKEYAQWISIPN
jgi:integrase